MHTRRAVKSVLKRSASKREAPVSNEWNTCLSYMQLESCKFINLEIPTLFTARCYV